MNNVMFTDDHLKAYADHLQSDHDKWFPKVSGFSVEFVPGSKYVKVLTGNYGQRSAHSFIDAEGKIWKAATWKAPAKNFSRGSILDGTTYHHITWAGGF